MGETSVVNELVGGVPTVVFYESRDGETALAFEARVDGQALTFSTAQDGTWIDAETGSTWTIDGSAIAGPMAGERLSTRADAYVLFWFAWRHFQPAGVTFGRRPAGSQASASDGSHLSVGRLRDQLVEPR